MRRTPRRFAGPAILAALVIGGGGWLGGTVGAPAAGSFGVATPPADAAALPAPAAASPTIQPTAVPAPDLAVTFGPVVSAAWKAPAPTRAPATVAGTAQHDPAKFGFAEKGMRGEVIAFMTQAEMPYVRDTADLSAISTVAFFGLQANAKGHLMRNPGWRAWKGAAMDAIRTRVHQAGAKLVVSIVRFSWDADRTAISRALLSSATRRQRLADEIAEAVVGEDADGVNLDFEPIPSGQRANFTDLTQRVRAALDTRRPGLQLTVAITGYFSSYDVKGLARASDAIYLMGYHYAGWWSRRAGSTSPMGGSRLDVAETVGKLKKAGVPARNIIVGIPYYAHLWPTRSSRVHARTTGRGRDLNVREALRILDRAGRRWDPVEQTAWAAWREGGSWQQIYVDDPRTLRTKWQRFQALGLLGTGIWSIGKEGRPGSINDALRGSWLVDP